MQKNVDFHSSSQIHLKIRKREQLLPNRTEAPVHFDPPFSGKISTNPWGGESAIFLNFVNRYRWYNTILFNFRDSPSGCVTYLREYIQKSKIVIILSVQRGLKLFPDSYMFLKVHIFMLWDSYES